MRYELYQEGNRDWRWRLVAKNGEILASGEGYRLRGDALHAIRLVKRSLFARVREVEPKKGKR